MRNLKARLTQLELFGDFFEFLIRASAENFNKTPLVSTKTLCSNNETAKYG